jgi:predicted ATPase/class 3 adenylate cyclase/tetratricopeptide (TPR) repeat protein
VAELPSGTVTFVFTDIEGSTRLWEEHPEAMKAALARHDEILRTAVESNGGHVVKTTGDGLHAVFGTAGDAVSAAVAAQVGLGLEAWGETGALRVRVGLHTGTAELRGGDYFGPALNRAARLMAIGHGGQVLVSRATQELVRDSLADGLALVDLGEHRFRDLERAERVFQVVSSSLPSEFPRLRSLDSFLGNLPVQVSSFVGRDREIRRVVEALEASRVVTLTGVGGVGKTRLALQVAGEVLAGYRDGVWLCELAALRSPEALPDALAATFGVEARQGLTATETLLEFLRAKELLVVLDNCEHLLKSVAELVATIGRSCPAVSFLATSREGLNVAGEHIRVVPSLDVPEPGSELVSMQRCEAVRLFVDRARGAKPDFAVDPSNAEAVGQICRRLDGVALAIELAAARVAMLTPAELAQRLDARFRVLTGGDRGAVERHQTLRAAIDWSYDLCDKSQQRLLGRLSVFAGGFTLDAAEAVCGGHGLERDEVFELLAALVARSLVVAEARGAETRYRLLETIRQYAQERLAAAGATDHTRARHAEWFASLIETVAPNLRGPDETEWVDVLTRDLENLRVALTWATNNHVLDVALRIVGACDGPNMYHTDVGARLRPLAQPTLALPGADQHPLFPTALLQAAWHAHDRGDQQLAIRYCDDAVAAQERLGTEPSAYVWIARAGAAMFATGSIDEFLDYNERAATVAREREDTLLLAWALALVAAGHSMRSTETLAAGLEDAEEALALARRTGNPRTIAFALTWTGALLNLTEPQRALAVLHEALELGAGLGRLSQGAATLAAALAATRTGHRREAIDLYTTCIDTYHWAGMRPYLGNALGGTAQLLADTEPEAAAILRGAAETLGGIWREGAFVELDQHATATIDSTLGTARHRELNARGAAMTEDEAVTYAHHIINTLLDTY